MPEDKKELEKQDKGEEKKDDATKSRAPVFNPHLIGALADEVSKTLMTRLPGMMLQRSRNKKKVVKEKRIENAIFLDTSAIIDGRIFDVITLGFMNGVIVLSPSILLELKHLADSQITVKRERGRKGLEGLEKMRKGKKIKVVILKDDEEEKFIKKNNEVDEQLIRMAKHYKGKVITCDYNLEKKAGIENVVAINMNALANCLKIIAVPGEALHIKLSHQGKDPTQGVGYLDDGTMIVVEHGSDVVGKELDVVVSRVIQTATGRILFAKKINAN